MGRAAFSFGYALRNEPSEVIIRIFASSGTLVKTLKETINSSSSRSCDIKWDGNNEAGAGCTQSVIFVAYSLQAKTA